MTKVSVDKRELNPEQKKAVWHGNGPLMIIAGAGTGKTTVITERINYLISSGKAKPHQILALTFTEKAAREMEDRVDRAMPYGVTQMWISTFHAFCDRILRAEAINIGIDPSYKLMTEAETIMFFRKHLFDFNLSYFRPLGNPSKFISGMITHFSRLKDEDVTPAEYIAWVKKGHVDVQDEIEKNTELAHAYKVYEELKVKEGLCDYSDLISHVLRIFRTRPHIAKRYRESFRYILIDEFQDTNYAQNELAKLLINATNNITVVGDDDQAIYRWRGAAISNMVQFRKSFPKTKVVVLTKNYRSTKEILDRSHDLVEHNNPDRLEITEHIDKHLESTRRVNGEKIQVIYADRVEHEAELVIREIQRHSAGETGRQWSDFAILVRANAHAEPFARALARAGIPYQFLGPGQLFRQPEVKDLIAYLKVLNNFEDSVAMYRVLSMSWINILPRDIAAVSNYAKKHGVSIFETCESVNASGIHITDESKEKITRVVSMINKHLGMILKETAGQLLYYFLEDTGLLKAIATYKTSTDEKIAGNISKLFNKLKSYETDHEDAGVSAVVEWIDLSINLGESPAASDTDWSENNAVNIMTIHSAKGLEFPVVFLINLVSQRFPTNERKDQIPIPDGLVKEILPAGDVHIQEERRLFYVGMTRARDHLYFTAAKFYGEGKREKKLSPFIVEATGADIFPHQSVSGSKDAQQLSFLDWKKVDDVPMKKKVLQKITYVSYSQISSFQNCPLQYKYRYIIKIPVPASAALVFGDTIHRTIQAFYEMVKLGTHPSREELLRLLDTHWSSLGFANRAYEEKMKRRGIELLGGFYDKSYDPGIIPTSLEESFKIKITPDLTLGGKIDRIDTHADGTIEIIDYKTGTAPKARDVQKDPQLSVYALSATTGNEIYFKEPEKVIVSFYFFEDQSKISATRTKEELEQTKTDIAAIAREISTSSFLPTPGKHCDYCEFRLICEAWN